MEQSETAQPSAEVLNLTEMLGECLASGVVVVGADHRICGLNPEAARLLRTISSELLDRPIDALPQPLCELVQETFATQAPVRCRQLEFPDQPGTPTLRACATICRQSGGGLVNVVLTLNDPAPSHKLGLNLQRLDRLASIGTFSASMAHEIKNALVPLSTFVQDLLERNKDAELASLVSRELHRVDSVVSQLLKFAGPARPTFLPVSLHRILDQSLRLIQPQLAGKQIDLSRSFAARRDIVDGDEYQLEQAFLNILLNAVAAMDSGGQLRVATDSIPPTSDSQSTGANPAGCRLDVAISDTGVGIPPERLTQIFEPFFSTKSHGTGLGLAIARQIVQAHHGRITVESQERQGTTFRIQLPLREA